MRLSNAPPSWWPQRVGDIPTRLPANARQWTRTSKGAAAVADAMTDCAEDGCDGEAAVLLRIPWDANREVCTGHARSLAQRDGVVAEPLENSDWP